MDYYTTDEINEKFDRTKRVKIAKLLWKKPTLINICVAFIKKRI